MCWESAPFVKPHSEEKLSFRDLAQTLQVPRTKQVPLIFEDALNWHKSDQPWLLPVTWSCSCSFSTFLISYSCFPLCLPMGLWWGLWWGARADPDQTHPVPDGSRQLQNRPTLGHDWGLQPRWHIGEKVYLIKGKKCCMAVLKEKWGKTWSTDLQTCRWEKEVEESSWTWQAGWGRCFHFFLKSLWKPGLIGSKLFSPIWACCGHDSNLVSDLPVLIPPHELFDLTSSPVLLMRKVRTWVKGAAGS